jgi:quercetin dioxygenase-like cupin family protein
LPGVGREMVNPVTGERFVWLQTAESTGGEFCECEWHLDEGAVVAAAHVHPEQQESFEVKSGSIRLRIGGREDLLRPGDARTIEAGTVHSWGNAASGTTVVLVRLTPALRSEDFFETFCGLARDGKANSKGIPRNPLQLAVLAHEYRHEIRLAGFAGRPPATTLVRGLATLGRAAGYRARYPQYASDRAA